MSIFNEPEFYPTPLSVIEQMGIDCYDKVCLEPSSGKGDLIDYLNQNGASEVLCCEQNKDLALISATRAQLIANDFFTVTSEQVSHVNLIVLNPPFSNSDKHTLHAWNIAPEGCEIIALCNWETIANVRGYGRNELNSIMFNYGESQNLGNCFSDAERTTNVEVGLIRLFKPVLSEDFNWDGFFYTNDTEGQQTGLMSYNDVRAIVNTYVAAVKCFDRAKEVGDELSRLTGETAFTITVGSEKAITTKEQFAREFQIKQWKRVFSKLNIEKYVTKGVMEDINKFTTSRLNYPFTMKNVYRMIDVIIGTRESTMNKAICEAVDNFTKHTHENRYGVEGWKTNEVHLLNKKFIVDGICEMGYGGGIRISEYGRRYDYLIDLNKAICYLLGQNFDEIPRITHAPIPKDDEGNYIKVYKYLNEDGTPKERMKEFFEFKNDGNFESNTWYHWGFFEFKVYKKGTGHFKFKDMKVWEILNRSYAKIKGNTLPEKFKQAA